MSTLTLKGDELINALGGLERARVILDMTLASGAHHHYVYVDKLSKAVSSSSVGRDGGFDIQLLNEALKGCPKASEPKEVEFMLGRNNVIHRIVDGVVRDQLAYSCTVRGDALDLVNALNWHEAESRTKFIAFNMIDKSVITNCISGTKFHVIYNDVSYALLYRIDGNRYHKLTDLPSDKPYTAAVRWLHDLYNP